MKVRDSYHTDSPVCLSCKQPQSPTWKRALCRPCFEKWKEKMIAEGKWDPNFKSKK